jgi:hypothetical protein
MFNLAFLIYKYWIIQVDTFADFDVMTEKLVKEIFYHLEMYGLDPARIRLFILHCS